VGIHRGGDGIRRVFEFLAPATVTLNSERRVFRPYGLYGGEPGQPGVNKLVRNGVETVLGGKASFAAQVGDRLVVETPGGGGWGHPAADEGQEVDISIEGRRAK
jgi:N-methylhydantoinase B/oxoprolinase/acetone carboxylase alpha subunit